MANGLMGGACWLRPQLVVAFIVETFDTSLGAIEEVEETQNSGQLGWSPDRLGRSPGNADERFQEGLKGIPEARHQPHLPLLRQLNDDGS
jgi:hypothetical protein